MGFEPALYIVLHSLLPILWQSYLSCWRCSTYPQQQFSALYQACSDSSGLWKFLACFPSQCLLLKRLPLETHWLMILLPPISLNLVKENLLLNFLASYSFFITVGVPLVITPQLVLCPLQHNSWIGSYFLPWRQDYPVLSSSFSASSTVSFTSGCLSWLTAYIFTEIFSMYVSYEYHHSVVLYNV